MTAIASEAQWKEEVQKPGLACVLCWAGWHAPSKGMLGVVNAFTVDFKNFRFYTLDTDTHANLAKALAVKSIPAFVFFHDGRRLEARVDEPNPGKVVQLLTSLQANPGPYVEDAVKPAVPDLKQRLHKLVNFAPVMVFMKGQKSDPFCKFSRQLTEIFVARNIEYSSFNILMDEEVRQGLKEYSDWPTYPQVYVNGEFIGGVDIIQEMDESNTLYEVIPAECILEPVKPLEERLNELIRQHPVMLFMKGNPVEPRCGFSSQIVQLLNQQGVQFGHFDILSDEDVRQGLKAMSNWPTYPQLYANGNLLGGLDIVRELCEEDALKEEIRMASEQ